MPHGAGLGRGEELALFLSLGRDCSQADGLRV